MFEQKREETNGRVNGWDEWVLLYIINRWKDKK